MTKSHQMIVKKLSANKMTSHLEILMDLVLILFTRSSCAVANSTATAPMSIKAIIALNVVIPFIPYQSVYDSLRQVMDIGTVTGFQKR